MGNCGSTQIKLLNSKAMNLTLPLLGIPNRWLRMQILRKASLWINKNLYLILLNTTRAKFQVYLRINLSKKISITWVIFWRTKFIEVIQKWVVQKVFKTPMIIMTRSPRSQKKIDTQMPWLKKPPEKFNTAESKRNPNKIPETHVPQDLKGNLIESNRFKMLL